METWQYEFFYWKNPELLARWGKLQPIETTEQNEAYRRYRDTIIARMEAWDYGTVEAIAFKAGFEEGKASER